MTRKSSVQALPAGPPVAQVEARRQALEAELADLHASLTALRGRRGELVLDGKPTDKIDAEIAALIGKERSLQDAALALEGRLQRAVADETRDAVERYNERVQQKLTQIQTMTERWEKGCNELGLIAGEILPLMDATVGLASPYKGLSDFDTLRRIPGAMVTQLLVAICPPDEPMGRVPFHNWLPTSPGYEMAQEFLRRGTPLYLLAETVLALDRSLPDGSPPAPEAA